MKGSTLMFLESLAASKSFDVDTAKKLMEKHGCGPAQLLQYEFGYSLLFGNGDAVTVDLDGNGDAKIAHGELPAEKVKHLVVLDSGIPGGYFDAEEEPDIVGVDASGQQLRITIKPLNKGEFDVDPAVRVETRDDDIEVVPIARRPARQTPIIHAPPGTNMEAFLRRVPFKRLREDGLDAIADMRTDFIEALANHDEVAAKRAILEGRIAVFRVVLPSIISWATSLFTAVQGWLTHK